MKPRFLICFIAVLLLPVPGHAWYAKTHSWLVGQAIEVIRQKDQGQRLYEELYADSFRLQMGRGGWREDYNAPIDNNSRAMRHYYDPASGRGIPYFDYFDAWPYFEPNEKVTRPAKERYDGALRWALDGGGLAQNPYHWKGAIAAYGHSSPTARQEAYYRLGHVLHLLGDMSEVDHATNTVHPGSGKYLPDTVEDKLTDFTMTLLVSIVQAGFLGPADDQAVRAFLKPGAEDLVRKAIHDLLIELARKPGTSGPVRMTGLEGIVEDSIPPKIVEYFFPLPENNGLKAAIPGLTGPPAAKNEIRNHAEFQMFFNELAWFARRQLPNVPPAVGCRDIRPVLLDVIARLFDNNSLIVNTISQHRFMKEPIFGIPTINEYDPDSFRPILQSRDVLLPETIAYTAGLMIHFRDLVKEPPYVQEVTIRQSQDRYYWAIWGEGQNNIVREQTRRDVENFDEISVLYTFTPRHYNAITGRTPVKKADKPLLAGRTAEVKIVFGPVLQTDADEIKVRIDPGSVKVRIDGKPISGRMEDQNTWVGLYTPEMGTDRMEKSVEVWIEAKDVYNHYLPRGPEKRGYPLDTNPATVPHVSVQMPDFNAPGAHLKPPKYEWDSYEDGLNHDFIDRSHRFTITREPVEEAVRGPRCSIEPSKTVLTISGRLDPARLDEERNRWKGQLDVSAPAIQLVLRNDGAAAISADNGKFEVRLEHRPGQAGGWREVWTAQPQPGRGTIRRITGPCQVSREKVEWYQAGNVIQMRTDRPQPQRGEWTAVYDKDGAYNLELGSAWRAPRFRLGPAADPPDMLVAQYLAWFAEGQQDTMNQIERIEKELVARGLHRVTGVASLCAANKAVFLRENPSPGDKEFSARLTAFAISRLNSDGPMHADRGEYILQAVVASKMNRWGDKGNITIWPEKALDRGVKAAPGFFPDTEDNPGYAGGIELLSTGRNRVAALKQKYKNYRPDPLFEGW